MQNNRPFDVSNVSLLRFVFEQKEKQNAKRSTKTKRKTSNLIDYVGEN